MLFDLALAHQIPCGLRRTHLAMNLELARLLDLGRWLKSSSSCRLLNGADTEFLGFGRGLEHLERGFNLLGEPRLLVRD